MSREKILHGLLSFNVDNQVVNDDGNRYPLTCIVVIIVGVNCGSETTEALEPSLEGTHTVLRSNTNMSNHFVKQSILGIKRGRFFVDGNGSRIYTVSRVHPSKLFSREKPVWMLDGSSVFECSGIMS